MPCSSAMRRIHLSDLMLIGNATQRKRRLGKRPPGLKQGAAGARDKCRSTPKPARPDEKRVFYLMRGMCDAAMPTGWAARRNGLISLKRSLPDHAARECGTGAVRHDGVRVGGVAMKHDSPRQHRAHAVERHVGRNDETRRRTVCIGANAGEVAFDLGAGVTAFGRRAQIRDRRRKMRG